MFLISLSCLHYLWQIELGLYLGGRASAAQVYPESLCIEILKGFIDQMRFDGRLRDTAIGCVFAVEEGEREIIYWDNLTGRPLDTKLVVEARANEMRKFQEHKVYDKVPVDESWKKTWQTTIENEVGRHKQGRQCQSRRKMSIRGKGNQTWSP